MAGEPQPMAAWTSRAGVPSTSARVVAVCLRSWIRTRRPIPASATTRAQPRRSFRESTGLPVSLQNTHPRPALFPQLAREHPALWLGASVLCQDLHQLGGNGHSPS